jgi:hypothetical protein
MDNVLNPLIQAHPAAIQAAFSGSAEHYTRVSFFDTVTVPQQPTALIVDDEWGLFGWFQRLTHQGVPFILLKSARKDFELFVEDCIELYRYGTRARHPMLFRYPSWQALEQDKGDDKAFRRRGQHAAQGLYAGALCQGQEPLPLGQGAEIVPGPGAGCEEHGVCPGDGVAGADGGAPGGREPQ